MGISQRGARARLAGRLPLPLTCRVRPMQGGINCRRVDPAMSRGTFGKYRTSPSFFRYAGGRLVAYGREVMSYCRWSSMNWTCDLYCYADITGGWTTHVAPRRRIEAVPGDRQEDLIAGKISLEECTELHRRQMIALERIPFESLRLPHAGETFHDSTLAELKRRL